MQVSPANRKAIPAPKTMTQGLLVSGIGSRPAAPSMT
jgi:hypothetical protein